MLSLHDIADVISKGRNIWYLGGGGEVKKKFVENVGRKKFFVEIDEKYVDRKNHQMVTYIIIKPTTKKMLHLKMSDVHRKEKIVFLPR